VIIFLAGDKAVGSENGSLKGKRRRRKNKIIKALFLSLYLKN